MNNYKTIIAAVAAGLACTAATSHATLVPNTGVITTLSGTAATPGGTLGGSLLGQELVQISNPTGGNDGTIDSWVLSGVSAAAGGLGGLTFVYQVKNLASSSALNIALSGFSGLASVDIEQWSVLGSALPIGLGLGVGTVGANQATLESGVLTLQDYLPNGGTTPAGIPTGGISDFIVVNTTATVWAGSYGQLQDGFSSEGQILAPVPEPTTIVAGALMLLPLGIGAVRALRKDRTA
jgi:hypothetical protein